jgi:hypothetical protein
MRPTLRSNLNACAVAFLAVAVTAFPAVAQDKKPKSLSANIMFECIVFAA